MMGTELALCLVTPGKSLPMTELGVVPFDSHSNNP